MLQAFLQSIAAAIGRLQRPDAALNVTPSEVLRHETQSFAETLARVAESQIGVREEGGNNKGKMVQAYQNSTWLAGTGWKWCAAFVCWCVLQALQVRAISPKGWERPRTAAAYDLEDWAWGCAPHGPNAGWQLMPRGTAPRRGDVVTFHWSHTGIVTGYDAVKRMAYTVEGNASAKEGSDAPTGDGVVAKTQPIQRIRRVIRFIG